MDSSSRRSLHAKAVTLQDVADQCGVCKATVSLALRQSAKLPAATIERIQTAARELGYRSASQSAARRLSLRKQGQDIVNHLIALFLPVYSHKANYFIEMFQGVLDVLALAGYAVVLTDVYAPHASGGPAELPRVFANNEVDGVIATTAAHIAPLIERLRAENPLAELPIVSMIYPMDGCSAVMTDDRDGAYQSACHLLDLGHRHLLHCVFPEVPGEELQPFQRIEGVRQALLEHGLDPARHHHLLPLESCWYSPLACFTDDHAQYIPHPDSANIRRRFLRYLDEHPEVTAILALNDSNALNAWYTLQETGRRIPQDISIIGFDDTDPMPGDHGVNLLTTVRLPLHEMGRAAARLAIRRITGELAEDVEQTLPVQLIVRHSTGPAPLSPDVA